MSQYGQSSHYSYSSGIDASFIDHLVTRPHTSWRGVRGVRAAFGAQDELDAELDEFDEEVDEELDDVWDPSDEEDASDDYGRLYMGSKYHELQKSSSADLGALLGRSGGSGYRGGRPTFGDDDFGADGRLRFGPIEYEGSAVGAFALGMGALVVMLKGFGTW